MGTDPVQGVLDRQPTFPPRIHHISRRRRVRSPRRPIQGRIRQTQTFCDHRLLGVRSGQLRDRIDLIQRKRPFGESRRSRRADPPVSAPPGPAGMPSHASDQTGPKPIPEDSEPHPPGTVDPDPPPRATHKPRPEQPPKDSENDRSPHRPDHSDTPSPWHPNVSRASDRFGSKPRNQKRNSEDPPRRLRRFPLRGEKTVLPIP